MHLARREALAHFADKIVRDTRPIPSPRRHSTHPRGMSHEIAKLLLEHAETFLERTEAVQAALPMGMPLHDIQDYLDWLDAVRGVHPKAAKKAADSRQPPANKPQGAQPKPPG